MIFMTYNEGDNPVMKYIYNRIKLHHKNFLGMFTGPTGSGKSYGSLKVAEENDPGFNINRVAFDPLQFLEIIQKDKTLKPGSYIVFEEVGVGVNARNWQSLTNKILINVMQTFRKRQYGILFNAPDFSYLDIGVRKLVHCRFETAGIDKDNKELIVKPKFLHVSQDKGEIRGTFIRAKSIQSGMTSICREIGLGLPSQGLIDAYEEKKTKYIDNILAESYRNTKRDQWLKENKKPLSPVQQQVLDLWKQGITSQSEIAIRLSKNQKQIWECYQFMAKKGYRPEDYGQK